MASNWEMMMMGWNYINKRGFEGGAAMEDATGGWRKGPWTAEEDKLLSHYVQQHGEGRWNSVSRITGLRRNGKSCRLRWVNYLRPDLKRGQITPHEETIILQLHARWGNRWSTIARSLPGRTDNEIKNYWRTHFKKKNTTTSNKIINSSAAAQKTTRRQMIRRQQFKQQQQQLIMMTNHQQQQLDMNKFASLQLDDDVTPTPTTSLPPDGAPHSTSIAVQPDDYHHNDYSSSEAPNLHLPVPPNCFLWDGFWDLDQPVNLDTQLSATTIPDSAGSGTSSTPHFMLSLPFD